MQCDPRNLLKQMPSVLFPHPGPSLNLRRRPQTLQAGAGWVGIDREAPGCWGDGADAILSGGKNLAPLAPSPLPCALPKAAHL